MDPMHNINLHLQFTIYTTTQLDVGGPIAMSYLNCYIVSTPQRLERQEGHLYKPIDRSWQFMSYQQCLLN